MLRVRLPHLKSKAHPLTLSALLILCALSASPRTSNNLNNSLAIKLQDTVAIIAYNVENLFNPSVDLPHNPDSAFTPHGDKHWTHNKLKAKLRSISQALISAAQHYPLAAIGLCEIEDRYVLNQLFYKTPLQKHRYAIIHRDSPDSRGIDVALAYRPDLLLHVHHKWIAISPTPETNRTTREMILASFTTKRGDTLHIIQCHWPSNFSGTHAGHIHRTHAIAALTPHTDSIRKINPQANIIIMGDMNTTSDNELFDGLLSRDYHNKPTSPALYSALDYSRALHRTPQKNAKAESYKFKGHWHSIDLMIISDPLIFSTSGPHIVPPGCTVMTLPALLEPDDPHGGFRPKRTFLGPQYHAGTSDHLPLRIILAL